jgi:hypothetical protein
MTVPKKKEPTHRRLFFLEKIKIILQKHAQC